MERHPYSNSGVLPWCDDFVDGCSPLCVHLVASWHGISSCGCSPFPEYPCKSSLLCTAILIICILLIVVAVIVTYVAAAPLASFCSLTCSYVLSVLCIGSLYCNCETGERFHKTEDSFGNPSWGTSWCNKRRASCIWWWMCHLQGEFLSIFLLISFSFFNLQAWYLPWECQEPMAKAKKLSCNHLFHLSCLRSWYDLHNRSKSMFTLTWNYGKWNQMLHDISIPGWTKV